MLNLDSGCIRTNKKEIFIITSKKKGEKKNSLGLTIKVDEIIHQKVIEKIKIINYKKRNKYVHLINNSYFVL